MTIRCHIKDRWLGASDGERSTNTHMRITRFLIVTILLILSQVGGRAMENQFIRKAGQYSLDDKGSILDITKQPGGSWTLKATWRSGDATSSAAPDDCLRADGWFVFVEKPGRIWIFDGVDGGVLLSNSGKETAVSSFSRQLMTTCPRKVWDALPEEVRARYQKIEPGSPANRSQPIRPQTNATSAAGGPGR